MSNLSTSERFYFSHDTLSLINKYSGSTFVIKYGGSAMKNSSLKLNIIQDISFLRSLGIKIILVHGGGYLIDHWLSKLNIQPKFQDGLRVTDAITMDVVEMVLSGHINKNLVSLFSRHNINSVGLSGKDASLVMATPLFDNSNNFAGRINKINIDLLNIFLSNDIFPVVASVATDLQGITYNINADTLASSIASSVKADKLILLTDTPGLLYDLNDTSTVIKDLNLEKINDLNSKGIIKNGMIPKINCCIDAINNNVPAAHIIDGRIRYSLLYEILTYERVGSMLVA
uniref:Acetylglutamate kinase n=1 Tax=Herposiphonia versicolor TaxID=2007163 RepID=A0A1Z1MG96_9FLOR|nr:acetylglutamate kinase [Herposiphonia versicolor]ARW64845.1 acetylglutamate kinase [Herposiphonia versicolor]